MGLNDELKMASTSDTVEKILKQAISFENASSKTRRRWKSVATRRLKEIQLATEKKTVSDRKEEKQKKKPKT